MSCITSPRVSNLNLIVRGRFFSNDYENTFHIYFVIGLTILDGCTFLNTNSRVKSQDFIEKKMVGWRVCTRGEKRKTCRLRPTCTSFQKGWSSTSLAFAASAILKISCLHAPLLPTCFNFFLPLKTPTILLQSPPLFNLLLSLISSSCFFYWFLFLLGFAD